MKFVETKYFLSQITSLKKLYPRIDTDYKDFKNNFSPNFAICLFGNIYKERRMNTSIPIGKRGGFRFIVLVKNTNIIPLLVYSKKEKETVTKEEIKHALASIFKELEK